MHLDFGGGSASIGNWKWDTANKLHNVKLANGTLNVTGTRMSVNSGSFTIENGGVLNIGSNVVWLGGGKEDGYNPSDQPFEYIVKDGGRLYFSGTLRSEWMTFTVEHGGYFCFTSDAKYGNGNRQKENIYNIYGTVDFPAGVTRFDNSWSVKPTFNLYSGGVLIIGGRMKKGSNWQHRANLMGGELRATSNVDFELAENLGIIKAGYDTTLNAVNSGTTLDLSNFILEDGETGVICTGAGNIKLPGQPYNLELRGTGTVTIPSYSRTSIGRLYVGSAYTVPIANQNTTIVYLADNLGTIAISAPGLTITALGEDATLTGAFTVDANQFDGGDTVVTSPSAAVRASVLAAATAAGLSCTDNGAAVTVDVLEEVTFTGLASSDLGNLANWTGTQVVPNGGAVTIAGAADFTSSSPAFSLAKLVAGGSITAYDGADIPPLSVYDGAQLAIAPNAAVTMTNEVIFKLDGVVKPVMQLGDGSVLTLDAGVYYPAFAIVDNGGAIVRTTETPLAFNWVGSSFGSFDDIANWTTAAITGQDGNGWKTYGDFVAASRLPCASDSFYSRGNFYFDLGGHPLVVPAEIGAWYVPGDWNNHYLGITNGVFTFCGPVTTHTGTWNIWDSATVRFASGTSFLPGASSGGALQVYARSGSLFEFNGELKMYNGKFIATDGGRMVLNATRFTVDSGSTQSLTEFRVESGGFMSLPRGLDWYRGGYDSRFTAALNVVGGELSLGGDVTKANINAGGMTFNVAVNGGKLDILDDITISVDSSTLAGAVEFNVAAGKFFYLRNFTVDAAAAITKTGDGVLVMDGSLGATQPESLVVSAGAIGFFTPNSSIVFPSNTTFAEGGVVLIGANGLTIASAPSNVKFEVDVESVVKDAAIVTSSDAALLAQIKADFETQLSGMPYEVTSVADGIVISAISEYVFTGSKSTDFSDPENWACGYVPEGKDVVISGDMAISGDFPVFASISIERGAAVSVADGITLPAVNLSLESSMTIAENATVEMGALTCVATAGKIPVLTVASGSTLIVPGGQRFGNVRLVLCDGSTLREASDGSLVFGYAANGETSYFEMTAENATISVTNSLSPNGSTSVHNGAARIDFACPEPGGRVIVPEPIALRNVTFERGYSTEDHYIYDGFAFGLNNPEDEAVKIVIDDSFVIFGEHSWIAGGANLVLTNNAVLCRSIFPNAATKTGSGRNEGDKTDNWFNLHINDLGVLTLVDGGELRAGVGYVNWDVVSGLISLSPSTDGHVGVEVLEGGIGCWYKSNGSQHKTVYNNTYASAVGHPHLGSIRFADGYMDVFKGNWYGTGGNRAHILNGMDAVDVPAGATMTFRGVKDKLSTEYTSLGLVALESPITGGGDVVVTNTWDGKNLKMVVSLSANTCTGSIKAENCGGTATAEVYFADGANWPGTVVANGNVKLIDVVGSNEWSGSGSIEDSPATVAFGALDLQADFPLRVWMENGAVATNDMLNVGTYLGNGGTLAPTIVGEGEFEIGDVVVVGKIAKDGALPSTAHGWVARRREIANDDNNDELYLKLGRGLQIIVY